MLIVERVAALHRIDLLPADLIAVHPVFASSIIAALVAGLRATSGPLDST